MSNFDTAPPFSEAIPPDDSEYVRAICVPTGDGFDWALLRGEGTDAVVDWYDSDYLARSGYELADSLGMAFSGPVPAGSDRPLRVRVSVQFPSGEGVTAWALARDLSQIVDDGDVLHRLVSQGDLSARALAETEED